jgi:hypothetical protein
MLSSTTENVKEDVKVIIKWTHIAMQLELVAQSFDAFLMFVQLCIEF